MSNRKAWIAVAVFAVASLLVISALWMAYSAKQQAAASDYAFYYSIECPHCKNVEDFIAANDIASKVRIVSKEVSQNESNRNEFIMVARSCGLNDSMMGVPLGYYQKKCYLGETENTAMLAQLAGVAAP